MFCRQAILIDFLDRDRSRFISGHVYAIPKTVKAFPNWNFITILRSPVERFISEFIYNDFTIGGDLPGSYDRFIDYLESDKAFLNGMTLSRYFSGLSPEEIANNPSIAIN